MEHNQHSAKYAFYYLLSLAALIFTALSVGIIAFNIIDRLIIDAVNSYRSLNEGGLRFAISAIFIAAPIFYLTSWAISRGLKKGELDKLSSIRRWLTYFILLVSALIILSVFIGLINNFLAGELSASFALKALAILVISGLVFSFYFYDSRRDILSSNGQMLKIFTGASVLLVLVAFVAAWFFVESPRDARARRLDQNIINNIYGLESAVNDYYVRYQELPNSLEEMKEKNIFIDDSLLSDPENKEPIVYQRLDEISFEFCALFRLDSRTDSMRYGPVPYGSGSKDHEAGYQCLAGTLYANPALKGVY